MLGVSCSLYDYQINRGWYHIKVPKVTVQRLFGKDTTMFFKKTNGVHHKCAHTRPAGRSL